MTASTRRYARRRLAKRTCIAFIIGYFVCYLGTWVVAESWRRAGTDADYYVRRQLLEEHRQATPHAKFIAMFGSSRMELAFAPETLAPRTTPAGQPLTIMNFSHAGAGPIYEGVILNRLIRDGVPPQIAIIEIMPPFTVREREDFLSYGFTHAEIWENMAYVRPEMLCWYSFRNRLAKPDQLKRALLGPEPSPSATFGGPVNLRDRVTAEVRQQQQDAAKGHHLKEIARIQLPEHARQALARILQTCQQQQIQAVVLISPEGPFFQALYDAAHWQAFRAEIVALAAEHKTRFLDARDWLAEEDFYDSHHPVRPGAERFTKRLIEALQPEIARLDER